MSSEQKVEEIMKNMSMYEYKKRKILRAFENQYIASKLLDKLKAEYCNIIGGIINDND